MFTQREKLILENVREKGGTANDAKEALNNFRSGKKRKEPRFLTDVGVGIAKGVGSTVRGLQDIGINLQASTALVPGGDTFTERKAQFTEMVRPSREMLGIDDPKKLKAEGAGQMIGKSLEFGVEVAGPGGVRQLGRIPSLIKNLASGFSIPKFSFQKTAGSQMEKALNLNPTDIRKIQSVGVNPSEWVLERGFQGNQAKIADDVGEYWIQSKKTKDDLLATIKTQYQGDDISDARNALTQLKNTFVNVPGNELLVSQLDELLSKPSMSLTEMERVKSILDGEIEIFTAMGGVKSGAAKRGLSKIREGLKIRIENLAKQNGIENIAEINKETQIGFKVEEAIRKRLDVKGSNFEFGLRDAILGGAVTAGIDLGTGAAVIATKKVLESSKFRSWLANFLKSLPDTRKLEFTKAVEQHNIEFLSKELSNFITLFLASGKAVDLIETSPIQSNQANEEE